MYLNIERHQGFKTIYKSRIWFLGNTWKLSTSLRWENGLTKMTRLLIAILLAVILYCEGSVKIFILIWSSLKYFLVYFWANDNISYIFSGVFSQVDLKASHESITVNEGEPYELVCNAPNVEIQGCMFIDPSGKWIHLWAGAS